MVRTVVVSAFYSSTDSNHETDSIWRLAVKNHRWYSENNSYHYRFFEQPLAPLPSQDTGGFYIGANSKPDYIGLLLDEGFDEVFWIDADSFFVSSDSLSRFDEMAADIVVCGDVNDIANTGHVFVRNTPQARAFIQRWQDCRSLRVDNMMREALSISHLLTADGFIRSDQTIFNGLLLAGEGKSFRHGYELIESFNCVQSGELICNDLSIRDNDRLNKAYIVRAAGCWIAVCPQRLMNSYLISGVRAGWWREGDWIVHLVGEDKKRYVAGLISIKSSGEICISKRMLFLVRVYKSIRSRLYGYFFSTILRSSR